ncbi:immune inhibitor A peptidase M6-domain-containing protein [Lipomyces starkeyi]
MSTNAFCLNPSQMDEISTTSAPLGPTISHLTKKNMSSNLHCNDERPCLVPPHPDLCARLQQHPNFVTPPAMATHAHGHPSLSGRTGTRLGLNDGTIFPESHFETAVSSSRISRAALERTPLRGTIRVAIVLVDFSDKQMKSGATQNFQDLFFSTGKLTTGSVTEYYTEVSGGKIALGGQVVGPFRMPHKLSYYANGESGMTEAQPNAQNIAADALTAAKSNINFGPYDNDGNGYVDAFVVVHAGNGAEETGSKNDIWSLKWVLPDPTFVDGVKVYAFLTIPEDAKVGVCAHELGHLLFGWPDLYDIDYTSEGIGDWCLMAGGSWDGSPPGSKPCHPSAWCKVNQGWVDEIFDTTNQSITLEAVENSRNVHRLWTNGNASSQEYFLLENRESIGFDKSLPGFGLLVWHIDDSQDDNHIETHYKVGLMQADGLNQLATSTAGRGDAGDSFPGSSDNTSFTSISSPNSRSYAGQDTRVSITKISPASAAMAMEIAV